MNPSGFLTLLTDFGWSDVYVGSMKGVIAQVNPALQVIDLTHQIPPQNIAAAQFNLASAYPYFPTGTVHVVVVDAGVGSSRRAIALELEAGFLVGPDNGLFTNFVQQGQVQRAVELTNSQYWRSASPSQTFHGRDIFAPVGAHLASGVAIIALGPEIDQADLVQLMQPPCTLTKTGASGSVQHIDRFGNVITNIPGELVQHKTWHVSVQHLTIPGQRTYSDVTQGSPLALVGSHGRVEIAVNGGDAHFQLRLDWDSPVQVIVDS